MKLFTRTLTAILLFTGVNTLAQDYGNLAVKGHILCDRKADVVSSVTIYRYYHLSQSVELMEQQMVQRNGKFKFKLVDWTNRQ
ncbi:MAG: hypothetical protein QF371_08935 [Flavobacteriales bacterium]|nr:hypothetical protein [Flavobacteriales bacterium]